MKVRVFFTVFGVVLGFTALLLVGLIGILLVSEALFGPTTGPYVFSAILFVASAAVCGVLIARESGQ